MAYRNHRVKGYRIITKKYLKNKLKANETFDIELLDYWLYALNCLNKRARVYKYKANNMNVIKHFYIDEIIENNENYIFGKFKTGINGFEQDFINGVTKEVIYRRTKNNTSLDDVFFYIYKNTGVLLIGNDPNNTINTKSISNYFKMVEKLCEPYLNEFNSINTGDLQIYKKQMLSIISLPPLEFFEEISKMRKIKTASFTIQKEDRSDSINVNKHLKDIDNKINVKSDDVEIEIKITNKSNKNFVNDFMNLFKIMNLSESFGDLKIKGEHQDGDLRTIKNNLPIRTFDCKLDYGSKNYPINFVQVKNAFDKINRERQLLFGEVKQSNVKFLGVNEDIINEIEKLALNHNKKFPPIIKSNKILIYN